MKWWGWGDENVAFAHEDKPELGPLLRRHLDIDVSRIVSPPVGFDELEIPEPQLPAALRERLEAAVGPEHLSVDRLDRVVQARRKCLRELVRQRRGELGRLPDVVVRPAAEDAVERLLHAAIDSDAVVIPFGGGSNISGSLERMCLTFIGYEGSAGHISAQRRHVGRMVRRHGGLCIGSGPGAQYDQKKFDTPYIRDHSGACLFFTFGLKPPAGATRSRTTAPSSPRSSRRSSTPARRSRITMRSAQSAPSGWSRTSRGRARRWREHCLRASTGGRNLYPGKIV